MDSTFQPSAPKILIVDDRIDNILALQVSLRDFGYEIFEATSGQQAFELARKHDFAVILLDVQMPILNGFQTAALIKTNEKSKATPIIFITASHDTDDYKDLGYDMGAFDYMFKPINTTVLKAKVAIFADLYRKAELLRHAAVREKEIEILKLALEARDDFLSVASHELKTPIAPLQLQMQAFINHYEKGTISDIPNEKILGMLRVSDSQLTRLSELIDLLLDVSRIREGGLELKREQVDLTSLILNVLEVHREEIKASQCAVMVAQLQPCVGYWDRFRMEQVITNLVLNAIKYGNHNPIEITTNCDSKNAIVTIKDEGIGIDPVNHERIFQRFERAVSNRNFGGLGLGLYIANQIINFHGGSIKVKSDVGKGATFTVEIPLTPKIEPV